jgi:hypothetical protein
MEKRREKRSARLKKGESGEEESGWKRRRKGEAPIVL